jgi:hypothetical protein
MFMQDASWHNQVLLQWMSKSPTAEEIDSEIGDLSTDYLAPEPLLTYIRYNVTFTPGNLNKITGKQYSAKKIEDLSEMSNAKNCRELYSIGEIAGNKEIHPSHFPEKFNL